MTYGKYLSIHSTPRSISCHLAPDATWNYNEIMRYSTPAPCPTVTLVSINPSLLFFTCLCSTNMFLYCRLINTLLYQLPFNFPSLEIVFSTSMFYRCYSKSLKHVID